MDPIRHNILDASAAAAAPRGLAQQGTAAGVSIFPWKQPKERIPLAVRQIHSFLRAHRPATAQGSR